MRIDADVQKDAQAWLKSIYKTKRMYICYDFDFDDCQYEFKYCTMMDLTVR